MKSLSTKPLPKMGWLNLYDLSYSNKCYMPSKFIQVKPLMISVGHNKSHV